MNAERKILILFAHPWLAQSKVNKRLAQAVKDIPGVTLVDLYEEYPHFLINVPREKDRLVAHDLFVFQHPFYWYSCPPLLKEWLDAVLEFGFAYGEGSTLVRGKDFLQVVSTGGSSSVYSRSGNNRFSVLELLRPFEATAHLCGWHYHHPLLIQGARQLTDAQLEREIKRYRHILEAYLKQGRSALVPWDSTQSSRAEEDPYPYE
jgi:glutathione-regulated potassium-efflux system ancillary protein KefG